MSDELPSHWLATMAPLRRRAPLEDSTSADVAILGAGYTGLWTAYSLLQADPSTEVLVVEREFAGFGASGRNGGWVTPHTAPGIGGLVDRFGRGRAHALHQALEHSVDEIGRVASSEGIEAEFRRSGKLLVARGEAQRPALESLHRDYEHAGFGDDYHLLDANELAARVRVAKAVGALWSPASATVHPGRLVRGLAEVVERRGGRIVEGTAVTGVSPGGPGTRPRMITDRGTVDAEVVVLAGEAYLSQLAGLHRRFLPIYSLVVVTEPIGARDWERIRWSGRESVASLRLTVEYLTRTSDDRILFGGRGAPYRFGSAITADAEQDGGTHDRLRRAFRDWFPDLADVPFADAWGGVLGAPRDGLPTVTYNPRTGMALAGGYTGAGVAASNLAARTLVDLILGRDSELTDLPIVDHQLPRWPPEPFRWLGVRAVERAAAAVDTVGEWAGKPWGRDLVRRVLP